MELSEHIKKELTQRFNWKLTNISELDEPVLIVFDYSPSDQQPVVSIAFDLSGGNKCWITTEKVISINDDGPKAHLKYGKFTFETRNFHPYSIKVSSQEIFQDVSLLTSMCQRLYQHVDWS